MTERNGIKIVVDSDGGIDDAAALWFCAVSPAAQLLGVSAVWGNVSREQAANNLRAVLEAAERTEVPVALGGAQPWGAAPELARATFVHGEHGLGVVEVKAASHDYGQEPAAELIARLCAEHHGQVTVVTLGPLSTIASLIAADPGWAATVARLVIMGGAVGVPGNALPASEANFAHDPSAAQTVVTANWRRPPLLVPLDATYQATLDEQHFGLLREHRSAAATFLDEPMRFYRVAGSRLVPGHRCPCHDLLAAMAALSPGLVSGPVAELSVDTGGSAAWGTAIADFRPSLAGAGDGEIPFRRAAASGPVEIGMHVDLPRFYALLDAFLRGDPAVMSADDR